MTTITIRGEVYNTNITHLYLSDCTTLPPEIGNFVNLTHLNLNDCLLTTLPPEIGNLVNLRHLYITGSLLITLPPEIGNLVNLVYLKLIDCPLTTLPLEMGDLRCLTHFYLRGCPIDNIPPNVQRIINGIKNISPQPNTDGVHTDGVHTDGPSVHNHIRESIINLLCDPKPPTIEQTVVEIVTRPCLTNETKERLMEYIESSDVHPVLNITFGETLCYVWKRIVDSEDCDEMLNILNTNMLEAYCMCLTERIYRLVNTLNGFYDDMMIL